MSNETEAMIIAIRRVGYRLDNRMDFTQNKVMWEVINAYQTELESAHTPGAYQ